MESRFADGDVENCGLLLLVPTCLMDPRFRHKREELKGIIRKAAAVYSSDMGEDEIRLETELDVWIDFWYGLA